MSDVKIKEEVTKEEQDKNGKHKESSSKKVQKESKQLKDLKAQVDKLEKQLASEAQMAEDGTIIAGGNTGKELRKASGLADEYGGSANDYVKKTSTSHTASDGTKIQTHWEENTRTGDRFNLKTKIEQVVKKWTSND